MQKLGLLLASALITSSLYAGGGYKKAVVPVVAIPEVVEDNSAFYLGLGYGKLDQTSDNISVSNDIDMEWEVDTLLFQAGYQYNKYMAVEGRYWLGINDATQSETGLADEDVSGDYSAWAIYAKPIYPLGDFSVYALLGYASVELEADDGSYWNTNSFSWGIGAQYAFTDNLLIFADYVGMGEADEFDFHIGSSTITDAPVDVSIDTINIGVNYKF